MVKILHMNYYNDKNAQLKMKYQTMESKLLIEINIYLKNKTEMSVIEENEFEYKKSNLYQKRTAKCFPFIF